MNNQEKENAVIYARAAVENGYSLEAQTESCSDFAHKQQFNVVKKFYDNELSGRTLNRQGLQELLSYCRNNEHQIKYIIVKSLDRISRSLSDLVKISKKLQELGIEILSATEPNGGVARILQRNLLKTTDKYKRESKLQSERVIQGMKKALKNGHWVWKAPLGYKNDKGTHNIVPDEINGKIVKNIFKKVAKGYSYSDLYWELEMQRIRIKPKALINLLTNPIYCGYLYKPEWFKKPIKGSFKPLVSKKIFNTVQEIIESNSWQK